MALVSRNLCTSTCPEPGCPDPKTVRLTDLLGKPLEARRYGPYAPDIGTRWDCPSCGTAYFVIWRSQDRFWAEPEHAHHETVDLGRGRSYPNRERGRFVFEALGTTQQTGYFVLDLSYYSSFNDEDDVGWDGATPPRHLVTDDCADAQWVW